MRDVVLRGFDWAGMKLRVEVPQGIDPARDWDLPDGFVAIDDDGFREDIRVSLTQQDDASAVREGTTWFHEGAVFEAGRIGSDHWLRRADDGRIALADSSFRFVHVAVPTSTRGAGFPLAHPLDDLILIHRALEQGAFALRATAAVRDGEALVVLGDTRADCAGRDTAVWQGWLLLQPGRSGIRVAPLPSTLQTRRGGQTCRIARLVGLHVVEPISGGDVIRVLDRDCAAGELLRYAFSPIVSPDEGDRLVETATQIARLVPLVQLQASGCDRFSWKSEGPMVGGALRSVLPAGA